MPIRHRTLSIYSLLWVILTLAPILIPHTAATRRRLATPPNDISKEVYTRAHSLGEGYKFDPRDGWEHVNITNLDYKYRRNLDEEMENPGLQKRGKKVDKKSRKGGKKKAVKGQEVSKTKSKAAKDHPPAPVDGFIPKVLGHVIEGLRGLGEPEPVTITWYTGHDLENPSCWNNVDWAPTDSSFACALTLKGWTNKPECFKFLELCHSPKTCVFVRVVDTCAGCAEGSKHVDLTKAAFKALADIDTGVLTVKMRPATEPTGWFEDLWGPKHGGDKH